MNDNECVVLLRTAVLSWSLESQYPLSYTNSDSQLYYSLCMSVNLNVWSTALYTFPMTEKISSLPSYISVSAKRRWGKACAITWSIRFSVSVCVCRCVMETDKVLYHTASGNYHHILSLYIQGGLWYLEKSFKHSHLSQWQLLAGIGPCGSKQSASCHLFFRSITWAVNAIWLIILSWLADGTQERTVIDRP